MDMRRVLGVVLLITMLMIYFGGCGGCSIVQGRPESISPTTALTVAEKTLEKNAFTPTTVPSPTNKIFATVAPAITEEVIPTKEASSTEVPVITGATEQIVVPTEEPTAVPGPTSSPIPTPISKLTPSPKSTAASAATVTPKPTSTPKSALSPTPVPEVFHGIAAGTHIRFGSYEQDADLSNGKEPIEWLVLEVKDGKAFLLSKYILDAQPYDMNFDENAYLDMVFNGVEYDYKVTWEKSTLRAWLNEIFYNTAFTSKEKKSILLCDVENLPNKLRGTDSGADTKDRVYLLSESDVLKYFDEKLLLGREPENAPKDTRHLGVPTEYAQAKGLSVLPNASYWPKHYTTWSLRTTGGLRFHNVYLDCGGFLQQDGGYVDGHGGVRPCMWINLTTAEADKT